MSGHLRTVILYGDSLVLHGVRASLETCPEIKIISLSLGGVSLKREIKRKNLVALIFDASAVGVDLPSSLLLQSDLLLIGINPQTHKVMVWSGIQAAAIEAADVLDVIRQKIQENNP